MPIPGDYDVIKGEESSIHAFRRIGSTTANKDCKKCPGIMTAALSDNKTGTWEIECSILNAFVVGNVTETRARIATVLKHFKNKHFSCAPIRAFQKLTEEKTE